MCKRLSLFLWHLPARVWVMSHQSSAPSPPTLYPHPANTLQVHLQAADEGDGAAGWQGSSDRAHTSAPGAAAHSRSCWRGQQQAGAAPQQQQWEWQGQGMTNYVYQPQLAVGSAWVCSRSVLGAEAGMSGSGVGETPWGV